MLRTNLEERAVVVGTIDVTVESRIHVVTCMRQSGPPPSSLAPFRPLFPLPKAK